MSRKEQAKKIGFVCLVLILVLVILISGLRILESTVFSKGQAGEGQIISKTIERNGVKYFPRQDITVMLIMGIDEFGPVKDSGSYNNTGEADMIALAVFDETNEQMDILYINRDTMVDMPVLGIGGKPAGTANRQIAVSHTYGSGLEDSCENTKKTVSDLLYGLPINYYVAMNMDAIPLLNDAVGGVTVTVVDDFSDVNPNIPLGETTLMGQEALDYVQERREVGDQKNISRMERQKEYMKNFLSAFKSKTSASDMFVLNTYEQVSDYIVTDLVASSMSSIWNKYADYQLDEVVTLQGENTLKNGHYAFILDKDALDALILKMFYAPK